MNTEWTQLFPDFPEALRHQLSQWGQVKSVEKDTLLAQPDQRHPKAFLVLQGRVKVFRHNEEGKELFLYYLHPGEACAISLMCAIRAEETSIIARADEPTTILMLEADKLSELTRSFPSWYEFIIGTFQARFDDLMAVLDSVAFRSLDEKLVAYLQQQVEVLGDRNLPLTHQQIADDLNSSREVISRLLKKMEQKGLIVLYRNLIYWRAK